MPFVKFSNSRLDLGQNHLFYFDTDFGMLSRLRYLDIRLNKFREFPDVVSCIHDAYLHSSFLL